MRRLIPVGVRQALNRLRGPHPVPLPPAVTTAETADDKPRFDGEHSRQWWETRDDAGQNSAEGYWKQKEHPFRLKIGETISQLDGRALLEVGCHAGPNFWSIHRSKQWDRLAGTELSRPVLSFAAATLPEALGRPIELVYAAADALPFEPDEFDVVLASGVLLCIGPDTIHSSLAELLRVTRKWLVLVEPYSDDPADASWAGKADYYPNTTYWIRNYTDLLPGIANVRRSHFVKAETGQALGHMDSILIFEKLSVPPPTREEDNS
ncbi:class I SAM-dependent methyltransferase [Bradyrhizobium sp. LjRoot220]|uniref:class I SAM-dependent methyltransferase n=1 Tax=Bradyrhizobium sp. LjRoot220 TaxID=3342284 RepID=UPI003ED0B641